MSIFKWRWQSQCWYFRIGKLAQSYWDEKLWNYVAFIGGKEADFLKKIERTEEVLKNYRNYGENWWISGVVFSAKLEGRNFSFFQVCQFSQETWILIKSKYFSHTSCNKSLILFIYQNCLYIVKACENDFYPHQSWYFWLTFFLMSLSFQKLNKNIV